MFIFFLLILVLIYFYNTGDMQRVSNNLHGNKTQDSNAKEIAAIRYAKGEISEEEYNKLRSVLYKEG